MVHQAILLAEKWLGRANELMTSEEKAIQHQMHHLLTHPKDKLALTQLIDRSFRSGNSSKVAAQINAILRRYGVPRFFSEKEKFLTYAFMMVGRHLPGISIPQVMEKIRKDSDRVILPGEPEALFKRLSQRQTQGVAMNINHLGEAVLGEDEAKRRLDTYLKDLANPQVENISVKISTIYSQTNPLAFDYVIDILQKRLALLYRAAQDEFFIRIDGSKVPKLVNLDMEEYRDLSLTVAAFKKTLNLSEFKNYSAGIVLQSYLPDAYAIQQELTLWAKERVRAGGIPIQLRIVKGANLEMEQVEASLSGWALASFDNKLDVDANYKRMLTFGMRPENIAAVRLAVGSHNLFDLAFAYKLAEYNEVTDLFRFEMLEGMADHVRRAMNETFPRVLLYAPVASKHEFVNAIAYLIRRLDENTAPDNFLRYAPGLTVKSADWKRLKNQFIAAVGRMDQLGSRPHRTQNRESEVFVDMGTYHFKIFRNEPDTDWSLPTNQRWAKSIRSRWRKSETDPPIHIPIMVAGTEIFSQRVIENIFDPSQFPKKICVAQYALASANDVETAMQTAKADPDGWRFLSAKARHRILSKVALGLRRGRADLIGAAVASTGKIFAEVDVEVSEAVDFAEYYPQSVQRYMEMPQVNVKGKGVGLVISPWNFPVAIPCGGIIAALSAGNTVVFKPSSDAVLPAYILCRIFWKAGVSPRTLQFLPLRGVELGDCLVNHKAVDFVILTGGTKTGLAMLAKKPDLQLSAETGGKNATIVTSMADRDQAIKNVIYSAFGNCGQKCSATSLLILEKEIYEDADFKHHLVDAARSLSVGSAWDFENKMGPLIRPPKEDLLRALSHLEDGESWALKPLNLKDNPNLWSPGIKWGVTCGGFTHMTEFFGPVLAVMCAEDLNEAISLANHTGYGLTAGIESLDPREISTFKAELKAGNLYINRGTTGAVTLRQPFGGMGKSALGPGIKAGSPNYVAQFLDYEEIGFPGIEKFNYDHPWLRLAQQWQRKLDWGVFGNWQSEMINVLAALRSYLFHVQQEFLRENDYFYLRGQDNILRYLPMQRVVVRVHRDDSLFDILARIIAVRISGSGLLLSLPVDMEHPGMELIEKDDFKPLLKGVLIQRQSDWDLIQLMPKVQRIRYAAPNRVPSEVLVAAAKKGFYIARAPVLMEGRIELLHYFINQSICHNYHRYGNVSERNHELNMDEGF
jgi:RHH-type proline utilization regulon transcriptional repressor/proline dehydrogenase/delta 1-pyrroline-5-carboxylate dehydrogenase